MGDGPRRQPRGPHQRRVGHSRCRHHRVVGAEQRQPLGGGGAQQSDLQPHPGRPAAAACEGGRRLAGAGADQTTAVDFD